MNYEKYGLVNHDSSLKEYNTYQIDTKVKYLIMPDTKQNLIELINNFPCFNYENKLNIPQDLSFRLCEYCEYEEKKENKKIDIVEKIRKSIDKSKNESN